MKKLLFAATVLLLSAVMVSCGGEDGPTIEDHECKPTDSELYGKLRLNEINVTEEDSEKYIELYNFSSSVLALEGVSIRIRKQGEETFTTIWSATSGVIYEEAFMVLKGMNNSGTLSGGFTVQDGVEILLVHNRPECPNVPKEDIILDRFKVNPMAMRPDGAQSPSAYARISNGVGNWYFDSFVGTPGETNGISTTGKTKIEGATDELATMPVINSVTVPSTTPANSAVTITANADAVDGSLGDGSIIYWINGDYAGRQTVKMTLSGANYSGQIPAQAEGTVVNFRVIVKNDSGGQASKNGYYVAASNSVITEGKVYINEVCPGDKKMELYNSEDSHVNIGGWKLAIGSQSYTFPANTIIPANGYVAFEFNAEAVTLNMPRKGGFRYVLTNGATTVDTFDNSGQDIINENFKPGESLGRTPDGSTNYMFTYSVASLGAPNSTGTLAPYVTVAKLEFPEEVIIKQAFTFRVNLTFGGNPAGNNFYFHYKNPNFTYWASTYMVGKKVADTKCTYEFSATAYTFTHIGLWGIRFSNTSNINNGSGSDTYTQEVKPLPYKYTDYLHMSEVAMNKLQFFEIYNSSEGSRIPLDGVKLYSLVSNSTPTFDDMELIWEATEEHGYIEPKGFFIIASSNSPAEIKEIADVIITNLVIPGNKTFQYKLFQPGAGPNDYPVISDPARVNRGVSGKWFGRSCTPDYSGEYDKTMCPRDGTNNFGYMLMEPSPGYIITPMPNWVQIPSPTITD